MLILVNLSLLWAVRSPVRLSHNVLLKPVVHMNHSARQRKKSASPQERQHQEGKSDTEAKLALKTDPYIAGQYIILAVLVFLGVGLLLSLYLNDIYQLHPKIREKTEKIREKMLRVTGRLSAKLSTVSGMASAHSAQRIIGTNKPFLIYGTAWKKEQTAKFVNQAVHAGFRFIDTACQPRHYNESGVGEGWSTAAAEMKIPREEFYLQTKFTSFDGQDPKNLPYDPESPLEEQVRTSLAVSLKNLKTDYLDCLVLHGPLRTMDETMQVWRVFEAFVDDGKVARLGFSNANYLQFKTLYDMARIKPKVAQNRFHAETHFDTELRHFCQQHSIWYQSFWTLTANRDALAHNPEIRKLADAHGLTPQTMMFAFLMSTGYITPLSGTTSQKHMAEDVAVMERIQGGEVFFHSTEELRQFSEYLGMPEL